jgi:hypothetical protein
VNLQQQLDATTRLLAEFQIKYAAEKNRVLELEAKLAAEHAAIANWHCESEGCCAKGEYTARAKEWVDTFHATEAELARVARLEEALRFYADMEHFLISDDTAWDTVSGEPPNWWCDEAGTATIEDGSFAKAVLEGKPIALREPGGSE